MWNRLDFSAEHFKDAKSHAQVLMTFKRKKVAHGWAKRKNLGGEDCGQLQRIDLSGGNEKDRETSFLKKNYPL